MTALWRYGAVLLAVALVLTAIYAKGRADGGDAVRKDWNAETEERNDNLRILAVNLAQANDKNLAQLKASQNETNRLRDCLLTGSCGLRVNAACGPRLDAASAGVDNGTGAELDATSRRAYFALRDGIDRVTAQLTACQGQLRPSGPPR